MSLAASNSHGFRSRAHIVGMIGVEPTCHKELDLQSNGPAKCPTLPWRFMQDSNLR
jgi:hypothetical protein